MCPSARELGKDLFDPTPGAGPLRAVLNYTPPLSEMTLSTARWAKNNFAKCNLKHALLEDSLRQHGTIRAKECKKPAAGDAPGIRTCRAAGVCLCSPKGLRLCRLSSAFNSCHNAAWPKGGDFCERAALINGVGISCLMNDLDRARYPAHFNVHPAADYQQIWLHIGLCYQSPWRLTFNLVRHTSAYENGGTSPDLPEQVMLED